MPHTTLIQPQRAVDYESACEWAKRVLLAGSGRRAVVFDVDDTLITKKGEGIQEVLDLVEWCRDRTDLECVIVTARQQGDDWDTHLWDALKGKIHGAWDVYLLQKPPEGTTHTWKSIMQFKYSARREVAKKSNIPVALTVGDQWWDVAHPGDAIRLELESSPSTYIYQRPGCGEAFVKLGMRVPDAGAL